MKKMLRIDSARAVGGFYEDIPALIIVTIGLMIFIVSFTHTYSAYGTHQESAKLAKQGSAFLENVRSYDGFLYEESNLQRAGVFCAEKLLAFSADKSRARERFATYFNLEFEFRIELIDVSGYPVKYNLDISSLECTDFKLASFKFESSACIVALENEVHAAKLIVTVWR